MKASAQTAFVTGASGFLGRHLRESLREQNFEVVSAQREPHDKLAETKSWRALLEEARPAVVFHLLGVIDALDDAAFDAAHLTPTKSLLATCLDVGLKETPIFILGSAAEYGDVPAERQPISEAEIARPIGAYGRSKLRATECALEFARHGLQVVVVRLFNVFGPGMSSRMMPGYLLRQLQDRSSQLQTGPLARVRDFLRAEVAMDALARLARTEIPSGTILNLCSGQGISSSDILATLLRAAGRSDAPVITDDDSARSPGVRQCIGNPARIEKLLGYRPTPPTLEDFARLVTAR